MKYLCLAYGDRKKWEALSQREQEAVASACRPHDEELKRSGRVIFNEGLQWTVATVRARNGTPFITDGPFAESTEQVGGVFLVEARDLNEALLVASKHPAAHVGEHLGWGIEVRPIATFEQS